MYCSTYSYTQYVLIGVKYEFMLKNVKKIGHYKINLNATDKK